MAVPFEEKIKVFISSKCGFERYDLIRVALKQLLEETGMIQTYIFEESSAVSITTREEYLNKLEDSHVVLFLIDNESSITEGVMKEWNYSKELQRKALYLFYNDSTKPNTSIQEELEGPYGAKFRVVSNIKDFISVGYHAVLADILNVYVNYCKKRLVALNEYNYGDQREQFSSSSIDKEKQELLFEKSIVNEFTLTSSYFKRMESEEELQLESASQLDLFSFKFISIIHGDNTYNISEVSLPLDELRTIHSQEFFNVVIIRWQAIQKIFENKIDEAILILEEAYFNACSVQLPHWFIDDILIDKRNLEVKVFNYQDKYGEVSSQRELVKRSHILNYPLVDRTRSETYRNILNETYEVNTKSPHATRIGTGIGRVLEQICSNFIFSICFGSFTHMMSVNELLYTTFYNFSTVHNYFPWKHLSFKFCILNVDIKSLNKVYRRNQGIITSCSFEKVHELYNLANAIPFTFESHLIKIKLFELLGYYFSDDDFTIVNKEIFAIIDAWLCAEKPNTIVSSHVSSCLTANIKRIDFQAVATRALVVFNKKYYRFFDDFFNVIAYVDWKKVMPTTYDEITSFLTEMIKQPESINKFTKIGFLILSMRLKNKQLQRWDVLVREHWPTFYENQYELETLEETPSNDDKFIYSCISEARERNKHQGKGGMYSAFASKPFKTIKSIMQKPNFSLNVDILSNILLLSLDVLSNSKQTTEEKVECVQLVLYLGGICKKQGISDVFWTRFQEQILHNTNAFLSSVEDGFFNQMTNFTLRTNLLFLREMLGGNVHEELFEIVSLHYNARSYDIIQLLVIIETYLEYCILINNKNNSFFPVLLQVVLSQINDSNSEVKIAATKCLIKFIQTEHNHIVYKSLSHMVNDADSKLKLWIIQGIKVSKRNELKKLLEKMVADNNYLVRKASREALNENLH